MNSILKEVQIINYVYHNLFLEIFSESYINGTIECSTNTSASIEQNNLTNIRVTFTNSMKIHQNHKKNIG